MKNILLAVIVLIIISCQERHAPVRYDEQVVWQDLFNASNNDAVACYRIPALVTTPDGSLIAAIDERRPSCGDLRDSRDINIVLRRSEDNGQTWTDINTVVDYPDGQSASDPSFIVDRITGEVFLFYNYMDLDISSGQYYFQYISSSDNGKSWSLPRDITDELSGENWVDDFKFITSGRGIQTRSGMLLHTVVNLDKGLHAYGSKDHGNSWFLIDTPITPGDESKIVELADGSWMINSRVNGDGKRYVHRSSDDGRTWRTIRDTTLTDPACNASLIRYTSLEDGDSKNRLLFSNANSSEAREHLTIRVSYDEGKTWAYSKMLYDGLAAYSSMTVLANGDIGVFFEKDDYTENSFGVVTLEWLTDGEDAL